MTNRMSSLPVAQFCSASAKLGEEYGAGRPAAMSTAFHAMQAKGEGWEDLFARLSDSEQEQVNGWKKPADIEMEDRSVLRYDDAQKELAVEIVKGDVVVKGHLDMMWVESGIAYVADIKKTEWTSTAGPYSTQLLAYGLACMQTFMTEAFCCGIWAATEGTWNWGDMYYAHDLKTAALEKRVMAAATNTSGEYITGPHCNDCYARLHCKEHLLPVIDPEAALAPLSEPGGITEANAYKLVMIVKAAQDLTKKVKENLEAYAHRVGGIHDGNGKVWRKLEGQSTGFDMKAFKAEHPEVHEQFSYKYARSQGFRWVRG